MRMANTNRKAKSSKRTSKPKASSSVSKRSQTNRRSNGETPQVEHGRTKHDLNVPDTSKNSNTGLAKMRTRRSSDGKEVAGAVFSYSRNQRKSWRLIDKQMKEDLEQLLDRDVKLVTTRFQNRGVQQEIRDLNRVFKSKLSKLLVPRSNLINFSKLNTALSSMDSELKSNQHQAEALERAIRKEERKIEELEEMRDSTETAELCLQIPKNTLNLPALKT